MGQALRLPFLLYDYFVQYKPAGPVASMAINQANLAAFESHLADAYKDLFANDPEYACAASRLRTYQRKLVAATPTELAHKVSVGLATGEANKDGEGIKRACKAVGIKHTYKAIQDYLTAPR
jgi:hypothetical protein